MILKTIIRATNTIFELLCLYLIVLLVAAAGYGFFEGKSYHESFWWAVVTATTTGYGDQYPVTIPGQVIAGLLMHVTLLLILPLVIGKVLELLNPNHHQFTDEEQKTLLSDVAAIKSRLFRTVPCPSCNAAEGELHKEWCPKIHE